MEEAEVERCGESTQSHQDIRCSRKIRGGRGRKVILVTATFTVGCQSTPHLLRTLEATLVARPLLPRPPVGAAPEGTDRAQLVFVAAFPVRA